MNGEFVSTSVDFSGKIRFAGAPNEDDGLGDPIPTPPKLLYSQLVITRVQRTPLECNLEDWNIGTYTVHALIHDPARTPYFTTDAEIDPIFNGADFDSRNQYYLNLNAMRVETRYSGSAIKILNIDPATPYPPTSHTYQDSVLVLA